jgi:hypothetical protein
VRQGRERDGRSRTRTPNTQRAGASGTGHERGRAGRVNAGRLPGTGRSRRATWEARLAGLRASAEAAAVGHRGDHDTAARQQELAASYRALHEAYRQRETVFGAIMADRADWDAATRAQRHLAVAADTELRRRHPGHHYPPLRSAEPDPATESQRAELTLSAGSRPAKWAGGSRTWAPRTVCSPNGSPTGRA